ncbi:MAG: SMI1/KNR4 family protein [Gemmatimonadota bacterium]
MYLGPPIDDHEMLARVPTELVSLLRQTNGYVAFHGGLHLRGACHAPAWHALRSAWDGPDALHALYGTVQRDDCPFAEDALGDQYLIRDGAILRLDAETGTVSEFAKDLDTFQAAVRADPSEYLTLAPLEQFRVDGGVLGLGQLLSVYPPFCSTESANGVSYRAIDALERRRWLASFAQQIRALPDGSTLAVVVHE